MGKKRLFRRPEKPGPESHIALHEATRELEKTEARWPDVRKVASALREVRVENHVSDKLRVIMESRRD